ILSLRRWAVVTARSFEIVRIDFDAVLDGYRQRAGPWNANHIGGDGALEDILRIAKKVVRAVERRLEPIEPVVLCKQVCNQRRRLFWLVILHIKQRTKLLKGVLSTLQHVDFHALHVHLFYVTARPTH